MFFLIIESKTKFYKQLQAKLVSTFTNDRFIRKVRNEFYTKANETMGLVPNPKYMRINTKSPKYFLMLKIILHKEWCRAFENSLSSLSN